MPNSYGILGIERFDMEIKIKFDTTTEETTADCEAIRPLVRKYMPNGKKFEDLVSEIVEAKLRNHIHNNTTVQAESKR